MLLSETERASFGKVSPSVLNRMGRRIEETALIALRLLLPEGVKAEKEEFLHSPYDIILISDGKEAYIEVKMALSKSALAKRVANAFRRPHPEPFAVLATVGYFDDPLEYAKAAKLYLSPSNSFRLNERNLRSFLRRCGMI
ncbi:MAG: hypothetical protein DRO05_02690 [Thermoproteota archaeon]|nr:MAG: hypothetical protein DRO05_02690 [Candidatus Korarchaeota archaeon]